MNLSFTDKALKKIYEKVRNQERLTREDGIVLYKTKDLMGVGRIADHARRQRHGNKAFFIYNQHLNYTNICKNRCRFCAYARDKDENGAYVWSMADVKKHLMDRIDEPIDEVHIVGGLNESIICPGFRGCPWKRPLSASRPQGLT